MYIVLNMLEGKEKGKIEKICNRKKSVLFVLNMHRIKKKVNKNIRER